MDQRSRWRFYRSTAARRVGRTNAESEVAPCHPRRRQCLSYTNGEVSPDSSNGLQRNPWHGIFGVRSCLHLYAREEITGVHRGAEAETLAKTSALRGRRKNNWHSR